MPPGPGRCFLLSAVLKGGKRGGKQVCVRARRGVAGRRPAAQGRACGGQGRGQGRGAAAAARGRRVAHPHRLADTTRTPTPAPKVIARLGRWLRTALTTSHLRFFKPAGLLAASGLDTADYASFAARFHMDVPAALVAEIMPFLAPLQQQARSAGGVGGEQQLCRFVLVPTGPPALTLAHCRRPCLASYPPTR
jgi:hypothetical protein